MIFYVEKDGFLLNRGRRCCGCAWSSQVNISDCRYHKHNAINVCIYIIPCLPGTELDFWADKPEACKVKSVDFLLKCSNFVLKMLDFVLKMLDFCVENVGLCRGSI